MCISVTSKQITSTIKWVIALAIAIVILTLVRRCGNSKKEPEVIKVVRDTVYVNTKSDTFYTPEVRKTDTVYKVKYKTDTLETFEYRYLKVDSAKILKDYLATRYYSDTVAVQYGHVYIQDTVSQNKIKSRGVKTNFEIPIVKETVTIEIKKRVVGYIGMEAFGNQVSPIHSWGASFGIQTKNGNQYEIKGLVSKYGEPVSGGIGIKLPIRLTKK